MGHILVFYALLAVSCGYALVFGGVPERATAVLFLVAVALMPLMLPIRIERYSRFELGAFTVDLVMYAAFLVMALRFNRYWLIWMSGLQGAEVATHILGMVDNPMLNLTYAVLTQMWSYPMLILLVVGTWRRQSRLRTIGVDNCWSPSSSPSPTKTYGRSPER